MRWISVLVLLLVLLAGVSLGGVLSWRWLLDRPGPLAAPVRVVIAPGTSLNGVGAELAKAGVVGDPRVLVWTARLMRVGSRLKAGEYAFEPGISVRLVLDKLALGEAESRSVTIPEGWTVKDALARLDKTDGLKGKASVPEEGRIFPDTYVFHFGTSRQEVLRRMEQRMEEELKAAWDGRDVSVPLKSPEELLILASIVEKEAANEAEKPRIAGVFTSRLRKGMRLQSDPTVIYGAEAYGGDIRHKDLKDANPFNTYTNDGLPPTPIANPGKASLLAAARPEEDGSLFFVALPDRSGHVFTRTYEEHTQHVKTYWREVSRQEKAQKAARKTGVSGTEAMAAAETRGAVSQSVLTTPQILKVNATQAK